MARKPGPWWRSGRKMWYVQIGGRQHALGITDPTKRDEAMAEVQRLIAEGVPAKPDIDPRERAAGLARDLLDAIDTLPGFDNRAWWTGTLEVLHSHLTKPDDPPRAEEGTPEADTS